MTMVAEYFAQIDGKLVTRWTMIDGRVMTGRLVCVSPCRDAFTVLRPDGTTCHVPKHVCSPASTDDVLAALAFFGRVQG